MRPVDDGDHTEFSGHVVVQNVVARSIAMAVAGFSYG
jgi:hypothetical protein